METREQLNKETYRQAVNFARHFADDLKQELEQEAEQRYQFEKSQFKQSYLQNSDKKRPLVPKLLTTLAAVFLLATAYYAASGRYRIVQNGQKTHQQFERQINEAHAASKNDRYIINLQNRLRDNPNNGDLWYELGQAYALNNNFDEALICYANAEKLLGKRAAILSAKATTHYYDNKQKMTPEIRAMIEEALSLDKNDSAGLLLLASDSFLNNNYQQALDYWRKVLDGNDESINRRAIIQSMDMARQMLAAQK